MSAAHETLETPLDRDELAKLREKAAAYVKAGATEAWVVLSRSRQVEIYGREGRSAATAFPVDPATIFG